MSDLPDYEVEARAVWDSLTGAEKDVLIALCRHGPLWAGDLPSKTGRDGLVAKGLAVRVTVKDAEQGHTAATAKGGNVYKWGFREPRRELMGKLVGDPSVKVRP
jgi:hypothetical protein